MSRVLVNGVRLDALLAMQPGEVLNAVPESERQHYGYWRGLHLGKIALNLLRGSMKINTSEDDNLIFFSNKYDDGSRIATMIATGDRDAYRSQWKEQDAQRFTELTGLPAPKLFGAAVVAARYVGSWPTSKYDPGWGNCVHDPVGFHEIDPYSLQALEDMFEVDLLSPPPEPGTQLPPAPVRDPIVSASVHRPWADTRYMPGRRPFDIG